jgi:hypothetical protein
MWLLNQRPLEFIEVMILFSQALYLVTECESLNIVSTLNQ